MEFCFTNFRAGHHVPYNVESKVKAGVEVLDKIRYQSVSHGSRGWHR